MERLTDEQKNFRDAIQKLLELYYLIKEIENKTPLNPKNKTILPNNNQLTNTKTGFWFTKSVVTLMAELFHKTIPNFSPCRFFFNPPFFHYRTALEFIYFETPIGKSHPFQEFIELIDALKSGLDFHDLFKISKITRSYYAHKKSKIRVPRRVYEMIIENKEYKGPHRQIGKHENESDYPWVCDSELKKNGQKSEPDEVDFPWMNYDDTKGNLRKLNYVNEPADCRIMPVMRGRYINDYNSEAVLKDLNDPPPYHEIFTFTCRPIQIAKFFRPIQSTASSAASPGYLNEKTAFIDAIKYILVKYVSLFGSFERLKVCKNCGKLFLEKKYGYGIFCNVRCRVNYHVELEPKDIFDCRNRQNRWLERKILQRSPILKDDCTLCQNRPIGKKIPKGGKCKLMIDKNSSFLARLPKRK